MELTCWIVDTFLSAAIIVSGKTFAKIVRLYHTLALSKIVPRPFPVKLVLVIAHQYTASHETSTWSSLKLHINTTKEQIILGPNVRSIEAFIERELRTFAAVKSDICVIGQNPIRG